MCVTHMSFYSFFLPFWLLLLSWSFLLHLISEKFNAINWLFDVIRNWINIRETFQLTIDSTWWWCCCWSWWCVLSIPLIVNRVVWFIRLNSVQNMSQRFNNSFTDYSYGAQNITRQTTIKLLNGNKKITQTSED